uniref:Uncharacterized protein n=1 Tax=Globodera pallida TaxID=36090 RepID=A0A183CNN7_GLOPA
MIRKLNKKVVVGVEQQQQQQRDNFFMEDQANVYSPPEVETESAATKIGFIKYAGAIAAADEQLLSSMSADQMTENGAVQQNIDADAGGGVCVADNDAEASRITPIMYRQHQQQQQLNRTNP